MLLTEGIVLGHQISPEGIRVDPTKVVAILKLPNPKIQKDVRSFLGYADYYRRLLVKDVEFHWNSNYQILFQILKEKLSTAPVLRGPN